MNPPNLDPMFHPESVAVVGASPNSSYSARLIENLLDFGFTGDLYLVNPSRDEAWNRKCYDSLEDVPVVVDLAVVSVPRQYVVETVEIAGKQGVPAALIITAGFGESDDTGEKLESELADVVSELGIRVCGPNSIGVGCGHDGAVVTSTISRPMTAGNLGLISHSGALAFITFFERAADEDVDFGYVVSTGNEADLSLPEYVTYLTHETDVEAICAYIEGLDDPESFMMAAEDAIRNDTPIIAIKVGYSETAAAAAMSHTGSITGDTAAWDAAFTQTGVEKVEDIPDMLARAGAHANYSTPESNRVCIASTSGGLASLLADIAVDRGLEVPDLHPDTESALLNMEELLTFGELHNPIDIRGYGASVLPEIAEVLFADDQFDSYVFAMGLPAVNDRAIEIVDQLETVLDRADAPVFVVWTGRKEPIDIDGEQPYERLREQIPVYYDPGQCLDAIQSLIAHGESMERLAGEPRRETLIKPISSSREVPQDSVLTWKQAESLLAEYDIPIVDTRLVTSKAEAVSVSREIGYPVVLKLDSPDIPHRTDAGVIQINLESDEEVQSAYDLILENAAAYEPDAEISGVLIQKFDPVGVEALVGVSTDPSFGPLVSVAPGGELVELHTNSVRIPPFTVSEAKRAIDETDLSELLGGYRGKSAVDVDSLAELMVNVGTMCQSEPIQELDLNPVFVSESGVSVVDIFLKTQ